MHSLIATYLPWLLSAITVTSALMAGSLHRSAWSLSLVNQSLWLLWIVTTHSWGFLPMNIALTAVFARNHWRWTRAPRIYSYRWHDHDPY